jgi:hypothetical protein
MAYIFIYGVYHGFIKAARLISIKDYLVFVSSYNMATDAGNRTNFFIFSRAGISTGFMRRFDLGRGKSGGGPPHSKTRSVHR